MGKVVVAARIENLEDLFRADKGEIPAEQVRAIDVDEAVIDTGATMLSLPRRLIDELGLHQFSTRRMRTAAGVMERGIFGTVRLTIQGRDCRVDVAEVADDCPVLIGQIPLEALDWVVDVVGQRLIGNPEHGGHWMCDVF